MESTSLIVISRNNYPVEAATFKRRLNRPGNHGFAAKVPDILAMDALAATPGGNDCEFHNCKTRRRAATTSSCCASLSAGNRGMLMASW